MLKLVETDQPGYMKDESTGAIINLNEGEYERVLVKRKAIRKEKEMCERMFKLEDELGEIKNMLSQLIRREQNEQSSC